MPHLLSRLTILAWLGCACTAAAQPDIQIVGPERLPYIVDRNGSGSGPAVELVRLIARAAGIDQEVRILPFQRAVRQLDEGDTLYPALLRTPPREDLYVWIGEVFADRAVLFTRRDGPPVSEIAAARRLERISVMRGSELHGILRSFGLQNVETNISEDHNARLLRAERIEAWFTLRAVGRATWHELGFPPAEIQHGEAFALMSFWIAGSRNLPPATVAKLRTAYDGLRQSGAYDRIVAPLREPPS